MSARLWLASTEIRVSQSFVTSGTTHYAIAGADFQPDLLWGEVSNAVVCLVGPARTC